MTADLCLLPATEQARPAGRHLLGARARGRPPRAHRARRPAVNAIVTRTPSARWRLRTRPTAGAPRRAAAAAARPADRAQGSAGHRGRAHDLWLAVLSRSRARRPIRCRSTRLREAGAIMLGKTNTPEWGAGSHTFNPVFGATRNPWDTARSAGGSSGGGAVALACRMVPLADGSDLGGSLRNPAAWNGVLGLRPTPGVVPRWPDQRRGCRSPSRARWRAPPATSRCCSARWQGPIRARRSRSGAAAPTGRAARRRPGRAPRRLEPGTRRPAGRARGARRRGPRSPLLARARPGRQRGRARPRRRRRGVRDLAGVSFGDGLGEEYDERRGAHEGHGALPKVERGRALTSSMLIAATRLQAELAERMRAFFDRYDYLACPVTQVEPFPVEDGVPDRDRRSRDGLVHRVDALQLAHQRDVVPRDLGAGGLAVRAARGPAARGAAIRRAGAARGRARARRPRGLLRARCCRRRWTFGEAAPGGRAWCSSIARWKEAGSTCSCSGRARRGRRRRSRRPSSAPRRPSPSAGDTIGGVCVNTGTIPSKTLREAAIYLTGLSERGLYGQSYRVKDEITIEDLIWRTQQVVEREVDVDPKPARSQPHPRAAGPGPLRRRDTTSRCLTCMAACARSRPTGS